MMVDFLILLIKNKDNVTFGFLYCFFYFTDFSCRAARPRSTF